jgi:hypothetical protein
MYLLILAVLTACDPDAGLTVINNPPEAEIVSHADGDTLTEGSLVTFRGRYWDDDGDEAELSVAWLLEGLENACVEPAVTDLGVTTCDVIVPAEDFSISLEVTDAERATGSHQLDLAVEQTDAPVAVITSPNAGGVYYSDNKTALEGVVSDAEDDPDALVAWFESDLDGLIGDLLAPTSDGDVALYATLSEGQHAVSLVVQDTSEKTGLDTVLITVGPPNRAPTCEITSPASGWVSQEGESVIFEATVDDPDVSEDWLTVIWSSDKEAEELGSSTPTSRGEVLFATSDLSVATHTVTMTVTDEIGETCSDLVLVTVGTPPTIDWTSPEADDVVNDGETVKFAAEVTDGQDASTALALSWTSELDGEFSTQSADSSGQAQFSTAELSVGVHNLALTATDTDGLYATALRTLTVNGLPDAPAIQLTPDPATTQDDLRVSIDTDATDPEGDAITYTYDWEVDGLASSASTSTVLPATATSKGEEWTARVTPSDGTGTGTAAEASVTIANSPPEVSGVSITPDPASASDELTCGYTFSDADGDADQSTWVWAVDGTQVGTDPTLSGAFIGGQEVTCTVTPADHEDTGTPASAALTIDNSAPQVSDVTIQPDPATATDTLTCSYTFDDADGDSDSSSLAWLVNGSPSGTGTTLSGTFVGGDVVDCQVTPGDGSTTGTTTSVSLTITNSAPTVSNVAIQPDPATAVDSLTCSYTFSDADGDSDASTMAWTVDGTLAGTGSTLAGVFTGGDEVVCTVTPDDGSDSGTDASASITIDNTSPGVADVLITPDPAQVDDTLACAWTFSDIDGDEDASTVLWDVDGTPAGSGSTLTGAFASGDTVTCTVSAHDGTDAGNDASASLTLSNSPPILTDVALSPDPATETDILTCTPGSTSDADGTTGFTYTYAWSVEGADPGETSGELDGTSFNKGDTVACAVTPNDGTDDGETVSSNAVIVENTPPSITDVTISPSRPGVADTLTCTASGFSDDDGDSDVSTWSWTIAGAQVGTDTTLSGGFSQEDEVTCTVTPGDGDTEGTALSDTVIIENTAPEVTSVSLSPSSVATNDTLTATVSADDADGDTITLTYVWRVDGSAVSETSASLDGSVFFDKGQQITVQVTPSDGDDDGTPLTSSPITVSNTPPTTPTVRVAMEGDDDDSDGDGVADSQDACEGHDDALWVALETGERCVQVFEDAGATWEQAEGDCNAEGGNLVRIASAEDNDHLTDLAESLTGEHLWIGYNDRDSEGVWVWTDGGTTTYENWRSGEPSGDSDPEDCAILYLGGEWNDLSCEGNNKEAGYACQVEVTPHEPDLICTIDGSSTDDDDDTLTYTITWEVDGTPFTGAVTTTESGDTIAYGDHDYEQTWTCLATANDGEEDGEPGSADYDTPSNEPPGAPEVTVSPAVPGEGVDDLVCSNSESEDAERDEVSYTYSWEVDGVAYSDATTTSETGDTVPAADTLYDEEWTCTVTPADAYNEGTPGSDSVTIGSPCTTATNDGVEYWFCEEQLSWSNSEAKCNDYGLTLVAIHIGTENAFLAGQAARVSTHAADGEFWIGLEDLNSGGGENWVWSDGSALDYIAWNESQPDSISQDCVVMILDESDGYGAGYWHDSECSSRKAFACE